MKKIAILAMALLTSGCVTLNESMLRVPAVQAQSKPVLVETQVGEFAQKFNGHGENAGVISNTTLANQVNKLIMNRWESKGIVSDWGAAGDLKGQPDYIFTLSGSRNEDGSIAGAIFSGLTFMVIPTSATLIYDLAAELEDKRTGVKYQAKAKNGITTVMEILLLPALPFAWIGSKHATDDIADVLYDQFRSQGAFQSGR